MGLLGSDGHTPSMNKSVTGRSKHLNLYNIINNFFSGYLYSKSILILKSFYCDFTYEHEPPNFKRV